MLRPQIAHVLELSGRPRVTVVRAGALGDTILTLPALQMLRAVAPRAEITLVGSAWAERLLPLIPLPLQFVRFDSPVLTPLFGGRNTDPLNVFAGADLVILFSSRDDPLCASARALCPGTVLVRPIEPPAGVHASLHFARAIAAVNEPDLPLPALRRPDSTRDGPVLVHPGSGGARKCWPPARFGELIADLAGPVVLLQGPADRQACRAVLEQTAGRDVAVRADLALPELATCLARCRLYVGNDSGVTHLAAALGTPTIAVFGPTDPKVWSARGPRVQVVTGRSSNWPAVRRVAQACHRML